jgi:hypothetical protein
LLATLFVSWPIAAQQPPEQASGTSVPLSSAWNIASSGKAASSGELLFRVTPGGGADPVEVSVFVLSGANETGVASSIRRALSSQLDTRRFDVEAGQGANVLVSENAGIAGVSAPGFAVELIDSDVENVRVMVQSAAPMASPTVPAQSVPAEQPTPPTPAAPGDAVPPANPQTPATPAPDASGSPPPVAPPPDTSASPAPSTPAPSTPTSPAPAPGSTAASANGGAGAPASAPPPPPASPGGI